VKNFESSCLRENNRSEVETLHVGTVWWEADAYPVSRLRGKGLTEGSTKCNELTTPDDSSDEEALLVYKYYKQNAFVRHECSIHTFYVYF